MTRVTWRRISTILIAFLLSAGGLVAVTAAPAAAAPCWSTGCNWLDPQNTGCSSGATNLDEFTEFEATIRLRYSSSCNAVWTRWSYSEPQAADGNYGPCPFKVFLQAKYNLSDGGLAAEDYVCTPNYTTGPTAGWTRMLGFSYWVRACSQWMSQPKQCTAWH